MKPKSRKNLIIILSAILVIGVLLLVFSQVFRNKENPAESKSYNINASDNTSRLAFLNQFGWQVQAEPIEVKDITIPLDFNSTYQKYNEIQQSQGFDLNNYKGKLCKRYTYKVNNYPQLKDNVYANIMVINDKIIGGDISSTAVNGFMHGFEYPNGSAVVSSEAGKYPVESSTDKQTLAPDPKMPNAPTD
jgi:hypothetical protein